EHELIDERRVAVTLRQQDPQQADGLAVEIRAEDADEIVAGRYVRGGTYVDGVGQRLHGSPMLSEPARHRATGYALRIACSRRCHFARARSRSPSRVRASP